MSLISRPITAEGAVVDVCIGVSRPRETVLRRVGHRVPAKVPLRLLIDTGSFITGLPLAAFQSLDIEPFDEISIGTASTLRDQPHLSPLYQVGFSFISGTSLWTIPSIEAIAGAGYDLADGVQGIIGRDILQHCNLVYLGKDRRFELAY